MPISPIFAGANTIAASPEWISPSADTMSTLIVAMIAYWKFLAFSTASSIEPTM